MLTCKDASRLISEREERDLHLAERWGLIVHLWLCVNCRRFERQMGFLRQALRQVTNNCHNDTCLSDAARERISSALKQTERNP
jgi:hypothetical protein